jgi:uncharacterized protein Usg
LAIRPAEAAQELRHRHRCQIGREGTDRMSLALQLKDYRLTTAEILYHLPDHPRVLQTYVWQEYDLAPAFPVLRKFLGFWQSKLDGKLHSVTVVNAALMRPVGWRHVHGSNYVN